MSTFKGWWHGHNIYIFTKKSLTLPWEFHIFTSRGRAIEPRELYRTLNPKPKLIYTYKALWPDLRIHIWRTKEVTKILKLISLKGCHSHAPIHSQKRETISALTYFKRNKYYQNYHLIRNAISSITNPLNSFSDFVDLVFSLHYLILSNHKVYIQPSHLLRVLKCWIS